MYRDPRDFAFDRGDPVLVKPLGTKGIVGSRGFGSGDRLIYFVRDNSDKGNWWNEEDLEAWGPDWPEEGTEA